MPDQTDSIILLPFNALAAREDLWPSLDRQIEDQWAEWHSMKCGFSLAYQLSDRFHMRDWTPARVRKERAKFLQEETAIELTSSSHKQGFVAVLNNQTVIGEGSSCHNPATPEVTDIFLTLSRPYRNRGYGQLLMKTGLELFPALGFQEIRTGIRTENKAAARVLEPLMASGVARKTHRIPEGQFYHIDLKKFRQQPAATAS